ncbi:MAG: gliding motility lipoprotein GldH [Muribaculum sp.]
MNKLLGVYMILLFSIGLGACSSRQNDYSEFCNLPPAGWVYDDTLRFITDIADSVASGTLTVAVRHNNNYPYSNLWLELTRRSGVDKISRDTVNLQLADIYGRWYGNGFGASYQFSDTVRGITRLFRGDTITVRHIMRLDTLPDVEQLGITFVSTESN